jgi:alanyl-tRNA synthetase
MQYNRSADGRMEPLARPCIDTGMGLERIAAVMQNVHSNYEIDLFRNLLAAAAKVLGVSDTDSKSLRVIADHIRSCAFLIADGVLPANEGRGYVLRRIMRRAIRHGNKLGAKAPFFHQLVAPLVEEMGAAYPELAEQQGLVERVLLKEEQQFARTLEHGMQLLEQAIGELEGEVIPGETVFRLYDTYGFPVDLTADVAREHGLGVDMEGFEREMDAQRERARAAGQFAVDYNEQLRLEGSTVFNGYDSLEDRSEVVALLRDGEEVDQLSAGEAGVVVLKNTSFYAESGGQVGDQGRLCWDRGLFQVSDCTKEGGHHLHHGRVAEGVLKVGDRVVTEVDQARRQATALNHSATHLLHAALRRVLGEHVQQKGSLVDAERLRFDFAHFEALTPEQIEAVELLVNEQIRANTPVETELTSLEAARAKGAMALFGEKYGAEVRVLTMGKGFSVELCGGTHARRTGDIGLLKIVAETGIASGVRRIEAVTGARALDWIRQQEQTLNEIAALLKGSRETVLEKVRGLNERVRQLEKEQERLSARLARAQSGELLDQVQEVKGVKVLAAKLDGIEPKALRDLLDQLKQKLGSGVVVLLTEQEGRVSLIAGVTKDLTARIKAGELVRELASRLGGKGGGRPDMAQGGGSDPSAVPAALAAVPELVAASL